MGSQEASVTLRSRGGYIPGLDGCTWGGNRARPFEHSVVFDQFQYLNPIGLSAGHTGVAVFFVLSGYLITTLLLREERGTGMISLRRFYIRRA